MSQFVFKILLLFLLLNSMYSSSQNLPNFSLFGTWVNEFEKGDKSSLTFIGLVFENDTTVLVKLSPGSDFYCNYHITDKTDFSLIHFERRTIKKDAKLPVLIFKVINKKTIKVQILDYKDKIEWNKNESSLNTGTFKRISSPPNER